MNSKLRKTLASLSAFVLLMSVCVTGMSVSAWTDGAETYDYGFTSVAYDNPFIASLATDFDAYKFVDTDKEGGTAAVWGPKEPSEQNPDSTSNITIWTTQWFGQYANGALKPSSTLSGDKSYSALTYTTKRLTDFKLQYTATGSYARIGIAFGGDAGVFPVSMDNDDTNDTGVMIFCEKEGHLGVGGAIDADTAAVTGGDFTIQKKPSGHTLQKTSSVRVRAFAPDCNVTVGAAADAPDYTLCIKVEKGVLTIYEKTKPNVIFTVKLTDKYQGGYVSLISNNAGQGSFKAFGVSAIEYADCTALDAQLARLNGLTLSNYTDATVDAVEALLAQEDNMRAKPKSAQAEVDTYVANLKAAIDALAPKAGNYTALNTALNRIPNHLDDYTDTSVAALNTAKAAAEAALTLDILQQASIDAAAAALNTAVDALTLKPADLTALNAALAAVPTELSTYTDESVAALQTAKANAAAAVAAAPDITKQAEIDALTTALNTAVDALALKPADLTALNAALAAVPTELSTYTDESVAALQTAKANAAAAVAAAPDITKQAEIDALTTALQNAVKGLTVKTNGGSGSADGSGSTGGTTGSTTGGNSSTVPSTGDSKPQIAFMVLVLLSGIGLAATVIAKKKTRA